MIKGILSLYRPVYPRVITYMLQRTEYKILNYFKWYLRVGDFSKVIYRGNLDPTPRAKAILLFARGGIMLQIVAAIWLIIAGLNLQNPSYWGLGIIIYLSYPLIWAIGVTLPIIAGRIFIAGPKERKLIVESRHIFSTHKATKIAVAGSYGKTSMKELLAVVLAEGKKVAVTPANKNVAISHAIFAKKLKGDEEVLVIEYGEGKPGDVAEFTKNTKPNIAVITGLAPAHLDAYPTIAAAGEDIFAVSDFLNNKNVYVNAESEQIKPFIKPTHSLYSQKGIDDWKVKNVKISFLGTEFILFNSKKEIKVKSGLLGRHQIGPLSAVAVIAHKLGLTVLEIEKGLAKTVSFEHRLEPKQLSGAWVIDDTYNGNIDGIRAGLDLLVELPAKRKIYVTPGLVDQGTETRDVHIQIGELIAKAKPDLVVLMKNSVVEYIKEGLKNGNFSNELRVERDPLNFYSNLDQFFAAGDLVMLQNDWPDNYF